MRNIIIAFRGGYLLKITIEHTMRCPFCSAQDTKVVDSRLAGDSDQIRRRRQCIDCAERFTTYETAELNLPNVVKSDGRREAFDEHKLRSRMLKSLEKRAVALDDIEVALNRIKHTLFSKGEREVPALQIGEQVMEVLRKLDHVAYLRFASVYLSFEDVEQFREVIDRLQKEPSAEEACDQLPLLDESQPQ